MKSSRPQGATESLKKKMARNALTFWKCREMLMTGKKKKQEN